MKTCLGLSAALAITIAGVDQGTADAPIRGTHAIRPDSNAIKTTPTPIFRGERSC